MALAPTLLTIKNVAVGVGMVALSGLAVTSETGQRAPTTGLATMAGNAPTITVQLGPTSDADVGVLDLVGQIPFLQRILVITTGLPDATPESNDLTPTLIWGDFVAPTAGLITINGLAPAVVGDTGQNIAITVGSAIINGLAPTLDIPAGQNPLLEPDKAEVAMTALEPTLFLEMALSVTDSESGGALLTITGLAPELSFQIGWTDVPAAGDPVWVDVPRV